MSAAWAIVPYVNRPDLTERVIEDLLTQDVVDCRVLVIRNGGDEDISIPYRKPWERVLFWRFNPSLLSLASVWNRALDFVWEVGGERALVCNNDVRLHPSTYYCLHTAMHELSAFFVSGVGISQEQWDAQYTYRASHFAEDSRGGPDFSCYLISKQCHDKYRFDEGYIPAYCVTPETPVLTADLRWEPIGCLVPGAKLVGVDEDANQEHSGSYRRRCYRTTEVLSTQRRRARCLRIQLTDGRVTTCSTDHKWLTKLPVPGNKPYTWRASITLRPGYRIATPLDVWHTPSTYWEGWLAGVCDGEANLRMSTQNRCEIAIAQKEGVVLDQILLVLKRLDIPYTWRVRPDNSVAVVEIAVRRHAIRLLGLLRPLRLLPKFSWSGLSTFSRSAPMDVAIDTISDAGEQEVVTIETTTGTYIANGMVAHNCEDHDYHRRLMLHGDGQKIFSVNVPYLHIDKGSGTLKAMSPEKRAILEQQIRDGSRAHHARKWGGGPNEELFSEPFSGQPKPGMRTSELFEEIRKEWAKE